jgi:hypothetical protein
VKSDVARLKTAVGRVANHNGSSAPTPVDEELTPDTVSVPDESQSVGR